MGMDFLGTFCKAAELKIYFMNSSVYTRSDENQCNLQYLWKMQDPLYVLGYEECTHYTLVGRRMSMSWLLCKGICSSAVRGGSLLQYRYGARNHLGLDPLHPPPPQHPPPLPATIPFLYVSSKTIPKYSLSSEFNSTKGASSRDLWNQGKPPA